MSHLIATIAHRCVLDISQYRRNISDKCSQSIAWLLEWCAPNQYEGFSTWSWTAWWIIDRGCVAYIGRGEYCRWYPGLFIGNFVSTTPQSAGWEFSIYPASILRHSEGGIGRCIGVNLCTTSRLASYAREDTLLLAQRTTIELTHLSHWNSQLLLIP